MSRPSVTVDYGDFTQAARELERAGFERRAGRTVAWAIRRSINLVRRNVRAELKPHSKSGKMRDRVRTRFTGVGMDFVGGMKSTGVASNLIVGGVKPHPIAVGKVMPLWAGKGAFRGGNGAGITGFAASVQHPGIHADPFVKRGTDKSMPGIQHILDESAATMVRELAYRMRGRG